MSDIDSILRQIKPRVSSWIAKDIAASAVSGSSVKDHGLLTGLLDDDHIQYVHKDTARTITAQHTFAPSSAMAPFVLSANAQGQLVTGLQADQLNKSVSVSGLGLSGGGALTQDRTITLASSTSPGQSAAILATTAGGLLTLYNMTVTNTLTVSGSMGSDLLPSTTDTYDIGSTTKLWRKGYLSELDAIIFALNTITLIGGWLLITKDAGAIEADVGTGDTSVDFGDSMTQNDFVLLRAAGKVEYMQVGTLVSGTRYNVTRNLDGSGADAWPKGTPYAVLGYNGTGRIELYAYDTGGTQKPSISIFEQGTLYNSVTERLRIGDMYNAFGTGANHRYGFGMGDYAGGNYLSYNAEVSDGLLLKASAGTLSIDANGIAIGVTDTCLAKNSYGFKYSSTFVSGLEAHVTGAGNLYTRMYTADAIGRDSELATEVNCDSTHNATVRLHASRATVTSADLTVFAYSASKGARLDQGSLVVGSGSLDPGTANGNIHYLGDLKPYRNSTTYTGYVFVPLTSPLTSTSWDGDGYSTTSKTLIDLSSVFGAPAGIKGVLFRVEIYDATAGDYWIILAPNNTSYEGPAVGVQGLSANAHARAMLPVPCDANGDVYYQIAAQGTGTLKVHLQIWGYWI